MTFCGKIAAQCSCRNLPISRLRNLVFEGHRGALINCCSSNRDGIECKSKRACRFAYFEKCAHLIACKSFSIPPAKLPAGAISTTRFRMELQVALRQWLSPIPILDEALEPSSRFRAKPLHCVHSNAETTPPSNRFVGSTMFRESESPALDHPLRNTKGSVGQ